MLIQGGLTKPSLKMGGLGFMLVCQQGQPPLTAVCVPLLFGCGSAPLKATTGGPSTALLLSKA